MVQRLKSISRPIHWSLLTKAAILGAVWLFLPFWVFLLAALYLYFVPIFQPFKLFFPFLLILFLAVIGPQNAWFAALLSAAFYMLLGIKDLILINRKAAHEIMVLLLILLLYTSFFSKFDSWTGLTPFVYSLILAVFSFFLIKGFLVYKLNSEEESAESEGAGAVKKPVAAALAALILWHFSVALLFAPINFFYQSLIVFISALVLMEIIPLYLGGALTRRRIMAASSLFFLLAVVILAAAQWGL